MAVTGVESGFLFYDGTAITRLVPGPEEWEPEQAPPFTLSMYHLFRKPVLIPEFFPGQTMRIFRRGADMPVCWISTNHQSPMDILPLTCSTTNHLSHHNSSPLTHIPLHHYRIPSPIALPYVEGSLGSRAAGIRRRDALPSHVHDTEIHALEMWYRFVIGCVYYSWSWYEVGRVRQLDCLGGLDLTQARADPIWIWLTTLQRPISGRPMSRELGYGIRDIGMILVEPPGLCTTTLEGVNQRVIELSSTVDEEDEIIYSQLDDARVLTGGRRPQSEIVEVKGADQEEKTVDFRSCLKTDYQRRGKQELPEEDGSKYLDWNYDCSYCTKMAPKGRPPRTTRSRPVTTTPPPVTTTPHMSQTLLPPPRVTSAHCKPYLYFVKLLQVCFPTILLGCKSMARGMIALCGSAPIKTYEMSTRYSSGVRECGQRGPSGFRGWKLLLHIVICTDSDLLLARGNTFRSDEDRLKLDELMALYITLVNVQDDAEMFDVNALNGEEVFVVGQNENVVKEVVDVAQVSTAATTVIITTEELTLAQGHEALKTSKPKVKGVVIQELGESTTTKSSQLSSQQSQDKGKGIWIEPVEPMKKKDQISFYEETALKLQAKFDEEVRLARDKAEKEKEANIALIETWDDIHAKIDADHQLDERFQA
ncbi:hypothetical protein Tco_1254686 [Tanacetum coccineum]